MISFHQIRKSYHSLEVLHDISFDIAAQEVFGIIGKSGAGKSSLLRIVNQLETHDHGTLSLDGQVIEHLSEEKLRHLRKDIGVVFQDFNLLSHLTVYENINLALKLQNKSDPQAIGEVLAFLDIEDKAHSYPNTLSGGQKQRVAIARALVTKPKILLCDEPTSSLDHKTTQDILNVLKDVNTSYQTTIVLVTHNLDVAKAICNRVAVLENGSITDIIPVKNSTIDTSKSYTEIAKEVLSL